MRTTIDRRHFLLNLAAVAATQSLSSAVRAAMGPEDKFDLLIKGGASSIPVSGCAVCATSAFATES